MRNTRQLLALLATATVLALSACDGNGPRLTGAPDDGGAPDNRANFDALLLDLINNRTNATALPAEVNGLDIEFTAQPNDEPTLQDSV